ncbi:zinc/manganese transport system substrate-binding protein [Homoserinimonas aerilata]|uniref:Zinc/manganese transport system substrate-binding protein n=1 Tax=Homoserinimonas aerilata TaxID=1162970 RepID=A0A542YF41_9MICO|nr:zinc ABC transporter substrate-binding protein [Homoserinimonas aerilata]TQL46584.1 zinc/manganese transport system substrate-binding protein [Homoserinimonas aerilata]
MTKQHRSLSILALVSAAALALTGCAASAEPDDGRLSIVASTNVYGDIASAVAGDLASVTSIIDSAAQDPHSYEATVQDQLALSRADIVIENGGGYDPFVDTMLSSVDSSGIVVISASEVSGLMPGAEDNHAEDDHAADDHDHADDAHADDHAGHDHVAGFNEHVWYSFEAMDRLAHELAHELGALDAANAAAYETNYESFSAQLQSLTDEAEALHSQHAGEGVAITEPVPLYLFEAIGLVNHTPDAFSEAVEEGSEVSPSVLLATIAEVEGGEVRLLAYNEQTAGAETERLLDAATQAGIAVIALTETLPEGSGYIDWMSDNLAAIAGALA